MIREAEELVVDASAMVDLLANTDLATAVYIRLEDTIMHVPAHFGAEVLSALGRLQRTNLLTIDEVETALNHLKDAPVVQHPLTDLLSHAWARRGQVRLVDGLYVALAEQLGVRLITTDARLARVYGGAELVVR